MLQRQLSKEGLQNVIEDKDQVRDAASRFRPFPNFNFGKMASHETASPRRRRRGRQSVYACRE